MKKYDIFVSFSQEDIEIAEQVVKVLEAYRGFYQFEYFFDKSDKTIAADYLERISDAISDSKSLLFLASQNAYASHFCSKELLFADRRSVAIYRYCLDNATPPQNLELLLIDQHCLTADKCTIEELVRQILTSTLKCDVRPLAEVKLKVNPQVNVSQTPTPTPAPAPKPKQKTTSAPKPESEPSFMRKLGAKAGWALLSAIVPIFLGVFSKKIFGREFDDIAKNFVEKIIGDNSYVAELTAEPNRKYRVGDFVTVGGVQGVVFQTKPQVKVVSAAESLVAWGAEVTTGAADSKYGKTNLAAVQRKSNWQSKYPAFKWCADLGEGWYLPSIEELETIYENKEKIDKALQRYECKTLGTESPHSCLWSSSESNAYEANSIIFSNGSGYLDGKTASNAARAVFALGEIIATSDGQSSEATVTVYNIGDIITVAGVQGVVFQTSPQVKVISVRNTETVWSNKNVRIGAADENDGKANMAVVKQLQNWQSNYPAFKWCADLGENWYLPAINELKVVYEQQAMIDKVLKDNGLESSMSNNMCFWSSTEYSSYNALDVHPSYGFFSDFAKNNTNIVYAICTLTTQTTH